MAQGGLGEEVNDRGMRNDELRIWDRVTEMAKQKNGGRRIGDDDRTQINCDAVPRSEICYYHHPS